MKIGGSASGLCMLKVLEWDPGVSTGTWLIYNKKTMGKPWKQPFSLAKGSMAEEISKGQRLVRGNGNKKLFVRADLKLATDLLQAVVCVKVTCLITTEENILLRTAKIPLQSNKLDRPHRAPFLWHLFLL